MTKPLIPAQRRDRIQEYLAVNRIARTADLCDLLETSEATVRRDLEWLEQEGILERTHGGAILSQRVIFEPGYSQRAQTNPEEKRSIGALEAPLNLRRRSAQFHFAFELEINRPDSSGGIIQRIPITTRLSVATADLATGSVQTTLVTIPDTP